ncbi:uncharacterized protein LOC106881411 [Octopus bimaculoides]|uniref:VWFC domain-containing protein n=1 Tax=Octopus bimaculoides TaxID=37653 RepID=A0A0L8FSJ5_OCTBM|nr:uncharacterized protein LOC106881411 [Octopus bimaculoides]
MKPTPICPNPQKQKNKCCETIYCQNPLSTNSNAVSNLAAYVKNPRSLIISFTPPFSGQLRKQLIGYEIQHATQTQNGTTTIVWSTEFFNASSTKQQAISSSIDRLFEKQTIKYTDVLGQHFSSKKQQLSLNISTPEDVFVQVNYLQPGTKYYIRIRVRIDVEKTQNYRHRFFEENVESRNINSRRNNAMPVEELISADKKEQVKRVLTPFSQIISVSTPAKGLGCYTDTQWLSEGETFNRSCSETCTCKNGDVVCKYICPPLKIVYPTDTCPNPRIETVAGVCCPQRKCNHTKANCKHQNVTLKHGDTIRDGCNEVCSCHDGMLVCRKLCHTNAPSIVNGCVQIYMPTHCCPVWICEQEKRPYTSALLSSVLRLKGGCSPSDKTITNAVRKSVLDRTVNDHSIELVAPIAFKVQVTCNGGNTSDGNQQKDGQFDLMMHLQWKINLKNTVERVNGTAELWKTVNRTVVALTNTQFRIMVGQSSYGPAVSEGNPELTYLCDVGFLKTESGCVKYENVDDTISNNIDLHFVVSILRRTSCLLEWHQLTTRSQNSTRALYVVHRERATNPANWTWSEALNSTTVHYKLESLLPGKRYEAGLMWLPNIHSTKRFLLTSLHFKTKLKRVTPDNHTAMKIATPLCVVIILIIAGVSIYLMWKRHHKMRKKTETTYYENKGFWIGMMEGQRNSMTS